jgi:hypothetical protein
MPAAARPACSTAERSASASITRVLCFARSMPCAAALRISKVLGDHYGGEFVKDPFRKQGINYEVCKTPKSDLFRDLLPLLNSRHITLPQHGRLIAQIVGLERRVSRAGKDSIAHAPQGQDDLVNAVAGCAAALHNNFYDPFMGCGDDDDPDGRKAWQAFRLWQHIARYG